MALDRLKETTQCILQTENTKNCWSSAYENKNYCDICLVNYYMNEERKCIKSSLYDISIYGGIQIGFYFVLLIINISS